MKTLLLTLTYLVGVAELILAVFFWVTHSKSEIRKVMALLAFSTGMWVVTNGLTAYTESSLWVDWSLKLLFVAGITTVSSLLHFSIVFPFKTFIFDKLHALSIYIPTLLFTVIMFFSNTIVSSYNVAPDNPGFVHRGPLFLFYEIVVSLYFLLAIAFLFLKLKKVDGLHKANTKLVLFGITLGGLPPVVLNLWFAFFGSFFNPLVAVLFSVFWVGFTTYIIVKK